MSLLKEKDSILAKIEAYDIQNRKLLLQNSEVNDKFKVLNEKFRDTQADNKKLISAIEREKQEVKALQIQNIILEKKLNEANQAISDVMSKIDLFQSKLHLSENEKKVLIKELKTVTSKVRKVQMKQLIHNYDFKDQMIQKNLNSQMNNSKEQLEG